MYLGPWWAVHTNFSNLVGLVGGCSAELLSGFGPGVFGPALGFWWDPVVTVPWDFTMWSCRMLGVGLDPRSLMLGNKSVEC